MKASIKTSLIVIAVALVVGLVGLVWFLSRSEETDETFAERESNTSGTSAFEVRVIMPRAGLPLGGILPDALVRKLDGTPSQLRFDHTSPGAWMGNVDAGSLELKADGWDLLIETEADGKVGPGTRLVFQMGLGGRQVTLNCRPSDPVIGSLITSSQPGSDNIGGRFVVELATCRNAESGKTTNWPPAPLTVRGSFVGRGTTPSPESKETRSPTAK